MIEVVEAILLILIFVGAIIGVYYFIIYRLNEEIYELERDIRRMLDELIK